MNLPNFPAAAEAVDRGKPFTAQRNPDGTVRIEYGDGDLCALVYGDLGLDLTAEEMGRALVAGLCLLAVAAEKGEKK